MSVASITLAGGGQEASLTITPLGGRQDFLANVNRWRGQLGLEPRPDADSVGAETIEVAGAPARLVDIVGVDGHMLGVISTRGDATWFYKLTGPDPLVADHRDAFVAFMQSIRFTGGGDE
jgi:hypothetical protein